MSSGLPQRRLVALALVGTWSVSAAAQGRLALTIDAAGTPRTARIIAGVPTPKPLVVVPPVYPPNLPALAEGKVSIKMRIGADGAVKDATVVSRAAFFDDSALAATRQARFEPVLINGTPTEVFVNRTVNYPTNRGPVTISDRPPAIEVPAPKLIKQVDPNPPSVAIPAGIGRHIIVEVVIGASGNVRSALPLRGTWPPLDQAVLDAVRQWTYEPTMVNGLAMDVVAVVTVTVGR